MKFGIIIFLGFIQALVFDIKYSSNITWLSGIISIISVAGFIYIITNKSLVKTPKKAFATGYLYGLSFFAWNLSWVYISMNIFGGASLFFSILANALMVLILAIYWGLSAYCIIKLGKNRTQQIFIAPAIIAIFEWIRSMFFIGFPWGSLGYAQIDSPLANFSKIGGVFFVSFICVLLASFILIIFLNKNLKSKLIGVLGIFTIVISALLLNIPQTKQLNSDKLEVALIQANTDVITKYTLEKIQKSINDYKKETFKVLQNNKPDLVIWAETAIPNIYQDSVEDLNDMFLLQQEYNFDWVAGIQFEKNRTANAYGDIYNSAYLQSKNGEVSFYKKQHLLAFGEYIPFRSVLSLFEKFVTIPMADFKKGELIQEPFIITKGKTTFKLAVSICFEAVFGNEIRQNAINSNILLNISNDAWFAKSKAQMQHFNIIRMRAIESQKTIIRATNTGISAIINYNGKVIKTTEQFKAGSVIAKVSPRIGNTIYVLIGDYPFIIFFVLFIFFVRFSTRFSAGFIRPQK